MPVLIEGLRELDADVILCQEAFEATDGSLSTWRSLASSLGLAAVYHPIRRKPRVVEGATLDSTSGLASLTRLPIVEATSLSLPDDPRDGERAALLLTLGTEAGLIRVANTHLTHLRDRDDLQVEQARALLASAWWQEPAAARFVAGDLNARPEHPVHDLLRSTEGFRGRDAYLDVQVDGTGGATIRRDVPGQATVEARIDYVYSISWEGEPRPARASRVVLDQASDGVLASDHFGVLAEYDLGTLS